VKFEFLFWIRVPKELQSVSFLLPLIHPFVVKVVLFPPRGHRPGPSFLYRFFPLPPEKFNLKQLPSRAAPCCSPRSRPEAPADSALYGPAVFSRQPSFLDGEFCHFPYGVSPPAAGESSRACGSGLRSSASPSPPPVLGSLPEFLSSSDLKLIFSHAPTV